MSMIIPVEINVCDLPDAMIDEIELGVWTGMLSIPVSEDGTIVIMGSNDLPKHEFCFNLSDEIQRTLDDMGDNGPGQIDESIEWCDGLLSVFENITQAVATKRAQLVTDLKIFRPTADTL